MEQKTDGRVPLIDEIRGISILLMVLYHACYDLVAIFGVDFPFFYSPTVNLLRDIMAGTFFFISGTACRFSRSNLRRGLMTFGLGIAMSLVTALFIPDQMILFGVLHCLGACMLLFVLLQRMADKLPPWVGALVSGVLFYLTFTVPRGVLGGLTYGFRLPHILYDVGFLAPLGFPSAQFFSSDYYPLIPWFFLFLCGAYLGIFLKSRRFPSGFYRSHCMPLAFVGRHTLIIYLIHQPIIYASFLLVFAIIR